MQVETHGAVGYIDGLGLHSHVPLRLQQQLTLKMTWSRYTYTLHPTPNTQNPMRTQTWSR